MKKLQSIICTCILFLSCMFVQTYAQENYLNEAIDQGITKGEFLSTLVEMMGWNESNNQSTSGESYVDLAKQHGIVLDNYDTVNQTISKEEAEEIFIRSMGYDLTTGRINFLDKPFENVTIDPQNTTQKMIIDMYQKIREPLEGLNGFYAIKSYPQIELLPNFDSVGFGWSHLSVHEENKVQLEMNTNNAFYLPEDFSKIVNKAHEGNVSTNLMVYASQYTKDQYGVGLVEHIITSEEEKKSVIKQIVASVNHIERDGEEAAFDGVVIDFEDIINVELAPKFNDFLKALKEELNKDHKKLYVTVPPRKYYKGYDYKTIGEIADKIILMAHDYYPKDVKDLTVSDPIEEFNRIESPLTPMKNIYNKDFDIYYALKDITDEEVGVSDKSKIFLQISFDAVQWRKGEKNNMLSVWHENPPYEAIKKRIEIQKTKTDFYMTYNKEFENPYFTYYDDTNNIENMIWYEDTRSILTKINLAKLFGIKNISIWRLGNIPAYNGENEKSMYLDTWQQICNQYEKH
ncbi:glycosyl hydrolase family 18 protein [Marinisporobacter balticus]|nr:glycosyl hydrolase family 18 protein [Marinisporobacter balticus]